MHTWKHDVAIEICTITKFESTSRNYKLTVFSVDCSRSVVSIPAMIIALYTKFK